MNSNPTVYIEGMEFGVFHIFGRDSLDYLHRQLSNEIRSLQPGEGAPVCYLNAQGRIRLYFLLFRNPDGEGFTALAAEEQRKAFIPELERLVFREEIEFADRSDDSAALILVGTDAEELLRAALPVPPPSERGRLLEVEGHGEQILLFRTDWTLEPTFLLYGSRPWLESFTSTVRGRGAIPAAPSDFHTMRIENGTPWPGFEVDDSMIPYECGLEGAVSLTKGCYVGQEVVARMANLGSPPRLLRALVLEAGDKEIPNRGTRVASGEVTVGEVLTSGWSERIGSPVALSSIRKRFAAEGTALSVGGKPATVKTFPLDRGAP